MKNLKFQEYPFVFSVRQAIDKQVEKEDWYTWATSDRKVEAPKPFKVEKREWKLDLSKIMWSWMP